MSTGLRLGGGPSASSCGARLVWPLAAAKLVEGGLAKAGSGMTPERSTRGGGFGMTFAPGPSLAVTFQRVLGGSSLCTGFALAHSCATALEWRSRLSSRRMRAAASVRFSYAGAARAPRGEVGPGDPGAEPPWDPAADFALLSARYMRTAWVPASTGSRSHLEQDSWHPRAGALTMAPWSLVARGRVGR